MVRASLIVFSPVVLLAPSFSAAQDCVTGIAVIYGSNSGIQPPTGYTKIAVDLNQGAGGAFTYLSYLKF